MILWYIYCALWCQKPVKWVLIFAKDTAFVFVGQGKNRPDFFNIFSDLCDTLLFIENLHQI